VAEDVVLNKGAIQHLIIDVADRLGELTSLDGKAPRFDIRKRHDPGWIVEDGVATSIGMTAYCLVDTTVAAVVADEYELFLFFNNVPEIPRLGPFRFRVNA